MTESSRPASLDPPPPPPPTFPSRNMPPPSPPRQHQLPPYQPGAQPPQSFQTGRDLPSLASINRPGSSMSISSIIGSDPAPPPPPPPTLPQVSPPNSGSAAPSPHQRPPMQPPAPRPRALTGPRSEYSPYKRSITPERFSGLPFSRATEQVTQSAGSSPRYLGSARDSPVVPRQGAGYSQQPSPLPPQPSSHHASPNEPPRPDFSRQSSAGPTRPTSQPAEHGAHHRHLDATERYGPPLVRHHYQNSHDDRRHHTPPLQEQPPRIIDRERPLTAQPQASSVFSPPRHQQHIQTQPVNQPSGQQFWRKEENGREPIPASREEQYRPQYTSYPSTTSAPRPREAPEYLNRQPSSNPRDAYNNPPPTEREAIDRRLGEQPRHPPYSGPYNDRHRSEVSAPPQIPGPSYQPRTATSDQQARKKGEEMAQQRFLVGVSPESHRKHRISSPMPQAVQGAQAQHVGPGSDPSIKSEFGRPFGGLGSGLSSAPTPTNGTSTPRRQSPFSQRNGDPDNGGPELDGIRMVRVGSRGTNKRARGLKDDDKFASDSGDGRGTPANGIPRAKRRNPHHPNSHL